MPAPVNREVASELLPAYYSRPGQLRQEYAVDQVLRDANTPVQEILDRYPPPGAQVFMPPRYGYDHTPLTIQEVLAVDRWAPQFRQWMSGGPGMHNRRTEDPPYAEAGSRNAMPQAGFTNGG